MKKRADWIISFIAAAVILISLIVIEVSFQTAQGWFDDEAVNGTIITLGIIALVLLIGYGIMTNRGFKAENKWIRTVKDVMAAAGAACMGVIAGLTIGAIATEFAYTFFSDFNVGTEKMEFIPTACTQAAVGIVLAIIAIVIIAVNGAVKEN